MAKGNVELMHECFPKHLLMGTARMKLKKKNRGMWQEEESEYIERSTVGKKKRSPPLPNYNVGLLSPQGHYSPKQWMNYLMNPTYTTIIYPPPPGRGLN